VFPANLPQSWRDRDTLLGDQVYRPICPSAIQREQLQERRRQEELLRQSAAVAAPKRVTFASRDYREKEKGNTAAAQSAAAATGMHRTSSTSPPVTPRGSRQEHESRQSRAASASPAARVPPGAPSYQPPVHPVVPDTPSTGAGALDSPGGFMYVDPVTTGAVGTWVIPPLPIGTGRPSSTIALPYVTGRDVEEAAEALLQQGHTAQVAAVVQAMRSLVSERDQITQHLQDSMRGTTQHQCTLLQEQARDLDQSRQLASGLKAKCEHLATENQWLQGELHPVEFQGCVQDLQAWKDRARTTHEELIACKAKLAAT